jgi:hypothetical protein
MTMTRRTTVLKEIPADRFKVTVLTDGTTAQVEIMVKPSEDGLWKSLGLGVAKRRKVEARHNEVGINLALARAFQAAADTSAAECRERGYEPFPAPEPVAKVVQRIDPGVMQMALRNWLTGLGTDSYDDGGDLGDDAALLIKYYFAALRKAASEETDDGS